MFSIVSGDFLNDPISYGVNTVKHVCVGVQCK
jgi:hypothetical protein